MAQLLDAFHLLLLLSSACPFSIIFFKVTLFSGDSTVQIPYCFNRLKKKAPKAAINYWLFANLSVYRHNFGSSLELDTLLYHWMLHRSMLSDWANKKEKEILKWSDESSNSQGISRNLHHQHPGILPHPYNEARPPPPPTSHPHGKKKMC